MASADEIITCDCGQIRGERNEYVLCPICNQRADWMQQNVYRVHREPFHPKRIKSLAPSSIERVSWTSPLWQQRQVFLRARAFKREFNYSTIQWAEDGETDNWADAYLFTNEESRIVGVVVFRYRQYQDAPKGWALQWVWFAPAFRRQGYLSKYWPQLRQRYLDFHVEPPVSDAMKAFLVKRGDSHLL